MLPLRRGEGAVSVGRGEGAVSVGRGEGAVSVGRGEGAVSVGRGEPDRSRNLHLAAAIAALPRASANDTGTALPIQEAIRFLVPKNS